MPKTNLKIRLRNRKNYLPTALIAIVLWGLTGFIIIRVDPILLQNILLPNSYLVFLLLVFIASFLTLALILGNTQRGFLSSIGLVLFLFLGTKGLGNFVNAILLIALIVSYDLYSRQNQPN
jgi:hypothetical protein